MDFKWNVFRWMGQKFCVRSKIRQIWMDINRSFWPSVNLLLNRFFFLRWPTIFAGWNSMAVLRRGLTSSIFHREMVTDTEWGASTGVGEKKRSLCSLKGDLASVGQRRSGPLLWNENGLLYAEGSWRWPSQWMAVYWHILQTLPSSFASVVVEGAVNAGARSLLWGPGSSRGTLCRDERMCRRRSDRENNVDLNSSFGQVTFALWNV